MPRRSHKKSRNGCMECKRRHIKCDESRPACSNCITVQRNCQYPLSANRSSAGGGGGAVAASPSSSSTSPPPTVYDFSGFNPPTPPPLTSSTTDLDGSVNLLHLELLRECTPATFSFWGLEPQLTEKTCGIVIDAAFKAPFLMYELLAFSAHRLHILHGRAAAADGTEGSQQKAALYHDTSVRLQTEALTMVNGLAKPETDEPQNRIGLFFFASMLGFHTFSETLSFRLAPNDGFNALLTRFLRYQALHRGVRVVSQGAWNYLIGSADMRRLLEEGDILNKAVGTGPECDAVKDLVKRCGENGLLSAVDCDALKRSLDLVQWGIDAAREGNMVRKTWMALSWQLVAPPEVAVMLAERSPPALVMLAYYAVLLHWSHEIWMVGDAGKLWIELIGEFVEERWKEYMVWPLEEARISRPSVEHIRSTDHAM